MSMLLDCLQRVTATRARVSFRHSWKVPIEPPTPGAKKISEVPEDFLPPGMECIISLKGMRPKLDKRIAEHRGLEKVSFFYPYNTEEGWIVSEIFRAMEVLGIEPPTDVDPRAADVKCNGK